MRTFAMTALVCGLLIGTTRNADAQAEWTDRGYLNIGFGVESGSSDLSDTKTFTLYEEQARIAQASTWSSGSFFDGNIGLRLWRNLSVGIGYQQESNVSDVNIAGTAPHPVFFNRPRTFTATESGLERKEDTTYMQIGWMVPINEKLDVLVSAGPSWFRLSQEVVNDVRIAEKGSPFTEVVVSSTQATRKKTVAGFNIGADATYILWQNDRVRIGGGAFVRYQEATASVRLFDSSADEVDTKVGGIQFGFGGRLRF